MLATRSPVRRVVCGATRRHRRERGRGALIHAFAICLAIAGANSLQAAEPGYLEHYNSKYLSGKPFKAFAMSPTGTFGSARGRETQEKANSAAMSRCRPFNRSPSHPCRIVIEGSRFQIEETQVFKSGLQLIPVSVSRHDGETGRTTVIEARLQVGSPFRTKSDIKVVSSAGLEICSGSARPERFLSIFQPVMRYALKCQDDVKLRGTVALEAPPGSGFFLRPVVDLSGRKRRVRLTVTTR